MHYYEGHVSTDGLEAAIKEAGQLILTTVEQWHRWARQYSALPFVRVFELDSLLPVSWREAWSQSGPSSFVLESGKAGRYTYLGLHPSSVIRGKGSSAVVVDVETGEERQMEGSPLDIVRRWMQRYAAPVLDKPDIPPFLGGCVGYWGYDVARSLERLPEKASDDLSLPDYMFMQMDELWIIDHVARRLFCAVHTHPAARDDGSAMEMEGRQGLKWDEEELVQAYDRAMKRTEAMKAEWDQLHQTGPDPAWVHAAQTGQAADPEWLKVDTDSFAGVETAFAKEDYIRAVRQIQRYIAQGDVFQVNLSLRQSRPLKTAPEDIYEWLRVLNPSPYMGLIRLPDFQLVSASPELLVKLHHGRVSTCPIAGTRRRGQTFEEDQALAAELLANEKERAEHIMLVDLERNDLGRICRYGSVKATELMRVERYSHVMHLVSQIEGDLADGNDALDVIAAAFPGGTITGAPKIRTMEIIEELEPVRRGPYTGSIGWIDYNGDMEFNIVIRTLIVSGGIGYIQAGAGIVIDSDPEREYVESITKTKALWKAIECSERA